MKFTSNRNRLNVALTRPKYKLIVVGNGKSVYRAKGTLIHEFLEYAHGLGRIYDWIKGRWMV